jgi:hypothetical protein
MASLHELQARLDQSPPDEKLTFPAGDLGMQARGAAKISGVYHDMIEQDHLGEVQRLRPQIFQHYDGPDARLETRVE